VVGREAWAGVFDVVDRIGHELADVIVGQPVVDVAALAARGHKPCHPQFREVLGDKGLWLADRLGQGRNSPLAVSQGPQQLDPCRIGQHPKDLDGQVDLLVVWDSRVAWNIICTHANMMTHRVSLGHLGHRGSLTAPPSPARPVCGWPAVSS